MRRQERLLPAGLSPKVGTRPPLLVGCPAGGSPLLRFPLGGLPLERRSPLEEVTCPFTWVLPGAGDPSPGSPKPRPWRCTGRRRRWAKPQAPFAGGETQPPIDLLQRLGASAARPSPAPPGPGGNSPTGCEAKRPWLGPLLRSISTMTPTGGWSPLLVPVGPINRHQLLDHSVSGDPSPGRLGTGLETNQC